jgi:hypothetical protein
MAGSFTCNHCGEVHQDLPMAFGFREPEPCTSVPANQRERRIQLTSDTCILDGEHHFVLGCLDLPITGTGTGDIFRWLVWVSLSEVNYRRMTELWDSTGRESEPPYFGWLCTCLPGYPETQSLKTNVHTRPVGERPFIELEPTDHPLAVEQRHGISLARARGIAEGLLHDPPA